MHSGLLQGALYRQEQGADTLMHLRSPGGRGAALPRVQNTFLDVGGRAPCALRTPPSNARARAQPRPAPTTLAEKLKCGCPAWR
jgi:hypothetical protein